MDQQSYFLGEDRSESTPTGGSAFRWWWWAILAPYMLLPISIGGLAMLGTPGVDGPFRSVLALGLFLGAGLVHVGLYKDAHHLRTTGLGWMPRYRWYALGGAAVLLGALLLLDVSVPGGLLGGILLSGVFGVVVTAPLYLGRRYLIARQQ